MDSEPGLPWDRLGLHESLTRAKPCRRRRTTNNASRAASIAAAATPPAIPPICALLKLEPLATAAVVVLEGVLEVVVEVALNAVLDETVLDVAVTNVAVEF